MREILIDSEFEIECTALVHSFVRLDRESEVEDVVGVGEGGFHSAAECAFEFCQIWEGEGWLAGAFSGKPTGRAGEGGERYTFLYP